MRLDIGHVLNQGVRTTRWDGVTQSTLPLAVFPPSKLEGVLIKPQVALSLPSKSQVASNL